ncbi:MAG: Mannose-1-phosphate guanylyltransferase/mannose-6-phosphate isomerase [candidate division TM6 bacterium GW2011_GWF2_32_72]|nr:MAG: Mannose-1-phosphate guanylyltransferase/mannose-6-phosphate isomerase [candidate division TM6 bacterium GW2011_GWF2_32_72]
MNKNIYCVILAGGCGSRLWPLSTKENPKQLLSLGSGSTMLEDTIFRAEGVVAKENIWIVTTKDYASQIKSCVGSKVGNILEEPCSRNTAAAIAFSCFEISKINKNAIVLFMPADHFISPKEKFVEFVVHAVDAAQTNNTINLFGIRPTSAATGYGYIEYALDSKEMPTKVIKFHEKPEAKVAEEYLAKNNMLWNSGIFCAKTSVFLDELKVHAKNVWQSTYNFVSENLDYELIPNQSIDVAVMEKSQRVSVLPVDFVWQDVGNLNTFLKIRRMLDGNTTNVVEIGSNNNLVDVKKKKVALLNVRNLCVVETDDYLLIACQDSIENVKLLPFKFEALEDGF